MTLQNRATDQALAWVPDMPGHSDFKNKPFAAMRTEQQQIWWLYWNITKYVADIEQLEQDIEDFKDETTSDLDAWKAEMDSRLTELEQAVYWLATGGMHYDMSAGDYRDSMSQERRMFQFENPFYLSVAEMGAFTVAEIGTKNCAEVGRYGKKLFLGIDDPDDVIGEQHGWSEASFIPNDYIRRDELEYVEVTNLEEHSIMGIPESHKATTLPPYAPYIRRGTVHDLAGLRVLWNQHFVGEDWADIVD